MSDLKQRFEKLALQGVRALQPYQPGKPVSELEREYGVSNIIKLASNENPLGASPKAIAAVKSQLGELERYPDGNGFALKAALSEKHAVDVSCITLGNGSNDILEFVARAFLAPGYNAVFSEHAFAVYPIVTQAVGAEARIASPNNKDHDMPYGHDLNAMRNMVNDQTRVLFVANPNNPTGTWIKSGELESFIADLPDHVIVVLDEAYVEYVQEDEYPDSLPWLEKYPNLVITRTFSKAYGLAGFRIGYSICHPDLANLLNRVRQPFNTNTLAQVAALAALDDPEHIATSVEMNTSGMRQLTDGFKEINLSWIPSVANFICVNLEKPGLAVYDKLLYEGVIVRPVANYALPDFLRVTIGTEEENSRFLNALKKVLQDQS
jgi:histidinol-phosphate aminotransferase